MASAITVPAGIIISRSRDSSRWTARYARNTSSGITAATGPFVSTPRPTVTYISMRKSRRRAGYRSASTKKSSVSVIIDVTAISMRIRRLNMKKRGPAARPRAASGGASGCADTARAMNQAAITIAIARPAIASRSTPTDTPKTWYRTATIQ
jgi:hypothetical protein